MVAPVGSVPVQIQEPQPTGLRWAWNKSYSILKNGWDAITYLFFRTLALFLPASFVQKLESFWVRVENVYLRIRSAWREGNLREENQLLERTVRQLTEANQQEREQWQAERNRLLQEKTLLANDLAQQSQFSIERLQHLTQECSAWKEKCKVVERHRDRLAYSFQKAEWSCGVLAQKSKELERRLENAQRPALSGELLEVKQQLEALSRQLSAPPVPAELEQVIFLMRAQTEHSLRALQKASASLPPEHPAHIPHQTLALLNGEWKFLLAPKILALFSPQQETQKIPSSMYA